MQRVGHGLGLVDCRIDDAGDFARSFLHRRADLRGARGQGGFDFLGLLFRPFGRRIQMFCLASQGFTDRIGARRDEVGRFPEMLTLLAQRLAHLFQPFGRAGRRGGQLARLPPRQLLDRVDLKRDFLGDIGEFLALVF